MHSTTFIKEDFQLTGLYRRKKSKPIFHINLLLAFQVKIVQRSQIAAAVELKSGNTF